MDVAASATRGNKHYGMKQTEGGRKIEEERKRKKERVRKQGVILANRRMMVNQSCSE